MSTRLIASYDDTIMVTESEIMPFESQIFKLKTNIRTSIPTRLALLPQTVFRLHPIIIDQNRVGKPV